MRIGMRTFMVVASLFGVMLISSCVRRPSGILSDSKMAPIIADITLAEAYAKETGDAGQNNREAFLEYILRKHGVSHAQFDSTMAWYGRNSDAYYEMCDLVENELVARRRKTEGRTSIEEESSDLWPYSRQSLISRLSASNAFDFSVPTTEVGRGERVSLKLRMNNIVDGDALLGVEYDNGQRSYLTRQLGSGKRLELVVQTDTGMTVSRIFGHLLVNGTDRLPLWLDSISLAKLPYDTMQYYSIHMQRSNATPRARRPIVNMEKDSTIY